MKIEHCYTSREEWYTKLRNRNISNFKKKLETVEWFFGRNHGVCSQWYSFMTLVIYNFWEIWHFPWRYEIKCDKDTNESSNSILTFQNNAKMNDSPKHQTFEAWEIICRIWSCKLPLVTRTPPEGNIIRRPVWSAARSITLPFQSVTWSNRISQMQQFSREKKNTDKKWSLEGRKHILKR